MRAFNTAGPVRADRDYQIAPLSRIDLEEVLGLIRDEKYFVLHAPRQTGKTSALLGRPGHGVGHVAPSSRPIRPGVYVPSRVERDISDRQRAILSLLAGTRDGYALREIVPRLDNSATSRQARENLWILRTLGLAECRGRGSGARWKRHGFRRIPAYSDQTGSRRFWTESAGASLMIRSSWTSSAAT